MYVSDWMTKKVHTVAPDDSIADAANVTKTHGVHHVPVMKGDKLKGILSDRDIKDYVPSKCTSLDVYELHYLLQNTKVRQVMKTSVKTVTSDTPVEEASLIMLQEKIGCLPVFDHGALVGIISDRDIFRALVDISGVRHGGHRIFVELEDRPGSIREVTDLIRERGFSLQSIMTSYEKVRKGRRCVVIRTRGKGDFKSLKVELEAKYKNIVEIRKG